MSKKQLEKIYAGYGNAIFNLQNWINNLERGNISKEEGIEKLNKALDFLREQHWKFESLINSFHGSDVSDNYEEE